MAVFVGAATQTLANGQQLQLQHSHSPQLPLSHLLRVGSAQACRIRGHGFFRGYSSDVLLASETAPTFVTTRPMQQQRRNGSLLVHANALKSSSRRTLQGCLSFDGRLQSQNAGQRRNVESLVVRAGSKRGVTGADGGQTLDIPLLGEFNLPDFNKGMQNLSELTPLKAAKWTTIVATAYAAVSAIAGLTVFNSSFWMYGSWLGVVWPWPAAILLGVWTLLTAIRQAKSGTKEREQVLVLAGTLVWLILVPLAHVHGFVDGWPILLYTMYYFFFSISSIVRERMYGTLSTVHEEPRWQSSPSQVAQIAFVVAIIGGHWAAAFESPFLAETWNWAWQSKLAGAIFGLAVVVHWNAIYFLGKYSDRLVNPMAVVMFGPYRWIRHPMYASYILLCAGYCLALRSYFSLLFLMVSCIAYYEQRTKLEEKNLVEVFGSAYTSYKEKTKHKYLPWLY